MSYNEFHELKASFFRSQKSLKKEMSILKHIEKDVDVKIKFYYDKITYLISSVEHQRLDQIYTHLINEIKKLTKELNEVKHLDNLLEDGSFELEHKFENLFHLRTMQNVKKDEFFIKGSFETYSESQDFEKNIHELVNDLNPQIKTVIKNLNWIKSEISNKNQRELAKIRHEILSKLIGIKEELKNIIIIFESLKKFEKILSQTQNNEQILEKYIKRKQAQRQAA